MIRKSLGDPEKELVLRSSAYRSGQASPLPSRSASAPPGVELDLLDCLQRRWLLALLVFGGVAILGTLWTLRTMLPIYQAEATIYIPPDLVRDNVEGVADTPYPTFVNQQILTIFQYNNLSQTLQQLSQKGIEWKLPMESERQAIARLRAGLDVQRVPDSYEVSITFNSGDPRLAAEIANGVAQSFLDKDNWPEVSGHSNRATVLNREKAALQSELQKQYELRAKLASSLQVVNLHKSTTLPDDDVLIEMRRALQVAHSKRIEAEEELKAGETTVNAEAEQIASADPMARTMTANLLQRQLELRERIKNMLPSHPVRIQAEAELARIDAELQKGPGEQVPKFKAQLMEKLTAQAEEARRIEMSLAREIQLATANIPGVTRDLGQAELVNSDIARIQDHLNRLEGQLENIRLRDASGDDMRMFSIAQPPAAPLKSQRVKAMAIVLLLALVLGVGVPVLLDITDSRIYDPATIEQVLGFPVIGMTVHRTAKTEQFANEHLLRLVSGIERGILDGAKNILVMGLKEPVDPGLLRDISRTLSEHKINVTVRTGQRTLEMDLRSPNNQMLIGSSGPISSELENCNVVLMDAPALVFSSVAERLAIEADLTLVVVHAGTTTRADLVRGARLLEWLNIAAIGVILQDVRVERASRTMRSDLAQYIRLQEGLTVKTNWLG
jgi:capsular polysaccharide biosynthesis protein